MSRLHIEEVGYGPAVVLLHGAPTTPSHLRPLADRLSRRFRTLLVHLPGYGESAPLRPYHMERSHGLVEESLAELGVTAAHLVGTSGGAYRSFALACRRRVQVLSVSALGAVADFTPDEAAGLVQYAKMLRDGVDPAPILEELMLSERGRQNPAWRSDVRAWAAACAAADLAMELEAFASAPSLLPGIAALEIPILLRVGLADSATPPVRSARIHAVARRATLQQVPDIGHAILCEDFEATAASVEAHLALPSR